MEQKTHPLTYIAAVLVVSWTVQVIIFTGMVPAAYMSLYMFVPAGMSFIFYVFADKAPWQTQAALFTTKVSLKTLLFAVFYPLLWISIVVFIALITGIGQVNRTNTFSLGSFLLDSGKYIVISFPMMFGEEYGWRGYLLPTATARWGKLKATFLVAVVWGLWHLPSYYIVYNNADLGNPFVMTILGMLLVAIGAFPYSYCFYLSRNILPCVLLHGVYDIVASKTFNVPSVYVGQIDIPWSSALMLMGAVGAVFAVYFAGQFKERGRGKSKG